MGPFSSLLAGWAAGVIVNYASDVLPVERKLGSSTCSKCDAKLSWKNYLLFNNCKSCGRPMGIRSIIVVIVLILASLFVWIFPPAQLGYFLSLLILTYFGIVTVIDLEHRLILHPVSAVGAVLGLIAGTVAHGIQATLLGGAAGLAIMGFLYFIGAQFAKYRARKLGKDDDEEALGFGDVILAGILGLMLGWPFIWFGLLLGILAGGLISLVIIGYLLVSGKYQTLSFFIAYGPYLILGATLVMFVIVPVRDLIVQ
jgi:leader peptidase (prepilin peptidase) / N-methyltransferase